jgi:hypothetical protein
LHAALCFEQYINPLIRKRGCLKATASLEHTKPQRAILFLRHVALQEVKHDRPCFRG